MYIHDGRHTSKNNLYLILFLYPCRGYYKIGQMFVTQRRDRFRPHKVYIFLISKRRRVDIAMSVCPSVRLSVCLSGAARSSPTVLELSHSKFVYKLFYTATYTSAILNKIGQLYHIAAVQIQTLNANNFSIFWTILYKLITSINKKGLHSINFKTNG